MGRRLAIWVLEVLLTAGFVGLALIVGSNWGSIVPIEGWLVASLFLLGTILVVVAWLLPDRALSPTLTVGVIAGGLATFDRIAHQQYWLAAGMFVLLILCAGSTALLVAFHHTGLDRISRARARRRHQSGQ